MFKWATIVDVKLPPTSKANPQSVNVELVIDDEEEFVGTLFFEIFGLDVNSSPQYTSHPIKDCRNSFNQLHNICGLFEINDIIKLKDTEITIMVGKKGLAISNNSKKDWVICLDSVPCIKGEYYSQKQAKKLLG